MHPGEKALETLLAGNARFVAGQPASRAYSSRDLAGLAAKQSPIAAVIACSDSRVAPEIVFDQPLGSLFVSRVPGNVAADSTKWMVDMAIADFKVPLLVVLAHSGCLAVGQVVNGITDGVGGALRSCMQPSVFRAYRSNPSDLWHATILENALHTIEQLSSESQAFRHASKEDAIRAVPMLYDMASGRTIIIES